MDTKLIAERTPPPAATAAKPLITRDQWIELTQKLAAQTAHLRTPKQQRVIDTFILDARWTVEKVQR